MSWAAAGGNGTPVTAYTVTSFPGGKTASVPGDATTATIGGLINGTGYTFTVVATNAVGDSPASTPSNQVTPAGAVVGFRQASLFVAENARTARLTVTRRGDTTIRASVNYARTAGTARAGTDFSLPTGTLTFLPGETTKTIPLSVANDPSTEAGETVVVSLSSPTPGALVASPPSMTVTIVANDQRPDGWISTAKFSSYVGNNVYNTTGYRQAKVVKARRTATKTFYVRVYNDGNVRNTLAIKGSAARAGSTVRYYSGTTNITKALRSAAGWKVTLNRGAYKLVTVKITILRTAAFGSLKAAKVTGSWAGDSTRTDTVKAVVRATR